MLKPRSLCASAIALTIFALIAITMPVSTVRGEPRKTKIKTRQAGRAIEYQPSTDPAQYVGVEVLKIKDLSMKLTDVASHIFLPGM
jgi:hypothetical protein